MVDTIGDFQDDDSDLMDLLQSTYNLSGGCDPAPSHPLFISFSVHALVNQVVNRRNKTANLRLCQLGIRSKLFSLDAHLLIYKR